MSDKRLVVAISSRALFNLDESHQIYENEGTQAYCQYQIENEDTPLQPGAAFSLVKKLLALNKIQDSSHVEIILLSRNSSDTGLRIFNSIQHHQLEMVNEGFHVIVNRILFRKTGFEIVMNNLAFRQGRHRLSNNL